MPREYVHNIHTISSGTYRVPRYNSTGVGVEFTDNNGDLVKVPWWQITSVTRCEPAVDAEPVTYMYPEIPVDDDADEIDDEAAEGSVDEDEGKAREWAQAPSKVVRAWAKDAGLEVTTTGPLSEEVRQAYAAAHSD